MTAPAVSNLTPAPGSLSDPKTPIEFDVTDVDSDLQDVLVWIKFADRAQPWMVWDGTRFWPPVDASSVRTAITDGYHFKLVPNGIWVGTGFDLSVYAVDTGDILMPITDLAAAIAASAGKTLSLPPGTYVLNGDVTDTSTMIEFQHGAVVKLLTARTLNSKIDMTAGGRFDLNGFALTLGGQGSIPDKHWAFDIRVSGSAVRPASGWIPSLTPENFGATNADYVFTFTTFDLGANTFTKTAHGVATGQLVGFSTTGALPTGIDISTGYYAIVVDANTLKVATTYANALAGTAIDLSGSHSGTHSLLVYEDVSLRAWRDACQWGATSAHGGCSPKVLSGLGYLCGGMLDARQIQWNSVNHHKEYRCLVWSTYNQKIVGPGARLAAFHFRPLNQLGSYFDEYQMLVWEIADDNSPITGCGASGFFMRAGSSADVAKTAMYCHDIRNFRAEDLEVNNWSSTRRRSSWLRLAGRDANTFNRIKTNCDIPVIFDYNVKESISLNANGIPDWAVQGNDTVLRDRKDHDHNSFTQCDLGTVDTAGDPNPWRACFWNRAGVVGRNLSIVTEGDAVGGIMVARDFLDGADQNLGARSGNDFTITSHGRATADEVYLTTTGTAPAGLTAGTWYYLIVVDVNTIAFASTANNAVAGTKVTVTDSGSGTHTISGTAFGGAAVEPRRVSNNWRICSNRIEGIANAHRGVFSLDIQRHQNGALLELTLEDLELAITGDARRSIQTGSSSYTSNKISGVRAEGVRRLGVGSGVRFGGEFRPLVVDAQCLVDFARDGKGRVAAYMVAQDNCRLFPESQDHWEFISKYYARTAIPTPQHWWLMQETGQDNDITDQQSAGTDIPLLAGGADTPDYLQLVTNWTRAWIRFTEQTNQKLNLNSTATDLDPTTKDVGMVGAFIVDNAWVPGGTQRDLICLGGSNQGPLLRFTSGAGTVFIRADTTDGPVSRYSYNDGVPFVAYLSVVHGAQKIRCWLRKFTGQSEVIEVTYTAALSNASTKCFGGFDGSRRSWQGYLGYGEHRNAAAARVDGFDLFDSLGWTAPRTDVYRAGHLEGLAMSRASAASVSVAAGAARSDDDAWDIIVPTPLTASLATSGAGGLDTGSEQASKHYALWLIADSTGVNAPALLWSLSYTSPTMPSGYDKRRLRGSWRNNGSSDLLFQTEYGNDRNRLILYDEAKSVVNVLTGGSATTFTDVDCSALAPPPARLLELMVGLIVPSVGGNATDTLDVRPNGANSSDGPWTFGPGALLGTSEVKGFIGKIPCDSAQVVEYRVSDADDDADLWLLGYWLSL